MTEDGEPTKRVVRKRVVRKPAPTAPDARPPTEAEPGAPAGAATTKRRPHVPRSLPSRPDLSPRVALTLSGVIAGLIAVGLTVLLMVVFELLRGTSTGGGAWGLAGLAVVLGLSVAIGSFLLTSLGVPQAGLTAFVGALLVLIVVLAVLLDVVFSPWMWLVIPALAALAYLATHWVLSRTES